MVGRYRNPPKMGTRLDFSDSSYVFDVVRFAFVAIVSLPIRCGETDKRKAYRQSMMATSISRSNSATSNVAPFARSRRDKNALSRIMAAFSAIMMNGR